VEEALFLSRLCSHVTVVHRRDRLRASRIMADRAASNPKISFAWNSVVEEVLDVAKTEVTGLRLRNVATGATSVLSVTGVFVAIGHQPNTDAFRGQVEMDEQGYVKAHHTRTSVEGVFAAGDVQDREYRQAVTAAGTGCMAALESERYLSRINA